MIEIINKAGLVLEIEETTVIPVELNNSLFSSDDNLFQEIVYSATTGWTDNNKKFTSFGHLVDAKNSVYEQTVQVIINGNPFYAGTFSHSDISKKLSFKLKVNFGSVAAKVKNTALRDIYTLDPVTSENTSTKMATLMKNSCIHPENYPFAFFPIYNDGWVETTDDLPINYKWMNNWNHAAQTFTINIDRTAFDPRSTLQVPFFKLSYIIKQVFGYLEFTLKGDIFDDPDFNTIYIYTRRALTDFNILPSLMYMPFDLKIGDFIQQISTRLKINFYFNVLDNTVTMQYATGALSQAFCTDLSEYIETLDETSVDDKKGYTVTLKTDETDEALNSAPITSDEKIFKPRFTLIVGDGETPVELAVSTLKNKKESDYSYPITKQRIDLIGEDVNTAWPIRLLRFTGMKSVSGGKMFPEALPLDLSERDATWYRFLNDSKKVVATFKIPSGILSRMTAYNKIGFVSRENTFTYAIPKQTTFSFASGFTERVTVKIESKKIVSGYDTPYSIVETVDPTDTSELRNIFRYKFAYENGSMDPEEFTAIGIARTGSTATFASLPAKMPADKYGVGGQPGMIYSTSGARSDVYGFSIRVYNKQPLYCIYGGIKTFFTHTADYYSITTTAIGISDGRDLLIVF